MNSKVHYGFKNDSNVKGGMAKRRSGECSSGRVCDIKATPFSLIGYTRLFRLYKIDWETHVVVVMI